MNEILTTDERRAFIGLPPMTMHDVCGVVDKIDDAIAHGFGWLLPIETYGHKFTVRVTRQRTGYSPGMVSITAPDGSMRDAPTGSVAMACMAEWSEKQRAVVAAKPVATPVRQGGA